MLSFYGRREDVIAAENVRLPVAVQLSVMTEAPLVRAASARWRFAAVVVLALFGDTVPDAEESSILVQDCANRGSISTVRPAGLIQDIYAGGIVGFRLAETHDENALPAFNDLRNDLRIEN